MNWTGEQQRAIDERKHNILVAAAAGSGKTAVLVERIKKLIIQDGVPIDRMLIVTFTNAAAAEMKEKIRKAINAEIDSNPSNSKLLREQLNLLRRSHISTFHSFALDVIRQFFYLIDVEPGFSICDEAESTVIKEDAMDTLLENYFEDNSEEFRSFLDCYSSDRNQNNIRKMIGSAYNVLQAMPYPVKWLDEKIDVLDMSMDDFQNSDVFNQARKTILNSLTEACSYSKLASETLDKAYLERLSEVVSNETQQYNQLITIAEESDWDSLGKAIADFSGARLTAKKDEKEDYAQVKDGVASLRKKAADILKSLSKEFFTEPLEEQLEELRKTHKQALTLRNLLLTYDTLFKTGKKEKKLVDFNDIEHYCLDILHDENAASYWREKFKYIFIDEYQDTNLIQEEIISKIKRVDNLFMVGDIKQSIYKFRLAEPTIFQGKYEEYAQVNQDESIKIDLNQNFRSKSKIIDGINSTFVDLMDKYDDAAKLYPGINYNGEYNNSPELKVIDVSTISDGDEELQNMKKAEIEALEVARLIKDTLGERYYDSKENIEKEIEPKDIVILLRSVKNYAEIFFNILKENGIEAYVDDNAGYFDTIEINVVMNLLSVIDNKHQDIPFISLLHSEIFGFSSDMLGRIRAEHKTGSYVEAFIAYGKVGKDENMRCKVNDVLTQIEQWQEEVKHQPLPKFIWNTLLSTGYYVIIGTMPAGAQRQGNLRVLIDKAESFVKAGQKSLYSFMKYIEAVKARDVKTGQVKLVGESENLVKIMTIHKSKGLEFPVVIVAGLGKQLNYTKSAGNVSLHKDIGIGMELVNPEEHFKKQTFLQKLIQRQIHKEEFAEEIRVLYVALTRAKDRLYLTGTVNDGENYERELYYGINSDTNYLKMINWKESLQIINCSELEISLKEKKYYQNPIGKDIFAGTCADEETKNVIERMEYIYPHKDALTLKPKYSVTELNQMNHSSAEEKTYEVRLAVPKFKKEEHEFTAAEKGTIYHGIMEKIDFTNASKEGVNYLERACKNYISEGLMTEEEYKAIEMNKILSFFETDIGKRATAAYGLGKLRRETPFNLVQNILGERVIVQGIIDCYFEENDELVLLDYKTNWIDKTKSEEEEFDRLRNTYRKQMEIYGEALGKGEGKKVKESYLYLFATEKSIIM